MKYIQLIALLLFSIISYAQKGITLTLNHELEGYKFEKNKPAKNDLENDFNINRLQYYISNFSITHDGGNEMLIPDVYVLVDLLNSSEETVVDFGSLDVDKIEMLNFYLGVDSTSNHADPSLWPTDHALAPKFPSMHWGWSSGYRFIALEGMSGPNLNQDLQFHCVGDEFFQKLSFPMSALDGDNYSVELSAEYANLLKGIDVSEGLSLHGNLNEIKDLATNFVNETFTSSVVLDVKNDVPSIDMQIYPTPSKDGRISIKTEEISQDHSIKIYNSAGKLIIDEPFKSEQTIQLKDNGVYFIAILNKNGKVVRTQKAIVQQ